MEHNTKLLQFRAPESLSEAIDAAAKRELQTKSAYVRRSVIDRLRADGPIGSSPSLQDIFDRSRK
jgi:hypothetical protein